jgi:hypothetical protein
VAAAWASSIAPKIGASGVGCAQAAAARAGERSAGARALHAEAAARFDRIVKAGAQGGLSPIEYVRSLYLLAQISDKQGDRANARDYYRRYAGC